MTAALRCMPNYHYASKLILQAREVELRPELVDERGKLCGGAPEERAHLGHEREDGRGHALAGSRLEAALLGDQLLREGGRANEARVLDYLIEYLRTRGQLRYESRGRIALLTQLPPRALPLM